MTKLVAVALAAAIWVGGAAISVADDVRTETVQFKTGTSGTSFKDKIKGYDSVQYVLGAGKGQTMSVTLQADNASAYFNIYEPGLKPGEDGAMYVGSINGVEFVGELPSKGDYVIQVYMMRNAARRDEVASYMLDIGIE